MRDRGRERSSVLAGALALAGLGCALAGLGCAAQDDLAGGTPVAYFQGGAHEVSPEELAAVALADPNGALSAGVLPARYDLGYYLPPPGAQGKQNSCVGWATGYGLMTYLKARQRRVIPHVGSEPLLDECYSPAFVYNRLNGGLDRGCSALAALKLLVKEGAPRWKLHPYDEADCSSSPSPEAQADARLHRLASFERVDLRDALRSKLSLFDGNPIVIAIPNDAAIQQLGGGTWRGPAEEGSSLHCLLIIGWDDERQAYRALNSWGTGWGEGGYGWLGYEAVAKHVRQAFVVTDRVDLRAGRWWSQALVHAPGHPDAGVSVALELDLRIEPQAEGGVRLSGAGFVTAVWQDAKPEAQRAERRITERCELRCSGRVDRGLVRLQITTTSWTIQCEAAGRRLRFRGGQGRVELAREGGGWGPISASEGERLRDELLGTYPPEVTALMPSPGTVGGVNDLVGRAAPYGEDLRSVLRVRGKVDLALTLSREGRAAAEELVLSYEGQPMLRDGEALRPIRAAQIPTGGARPIRQLPPGGVGAPVLQDARFVRTIGGDFFLDGGLKRPLVQGAARRLGVQLESIGEAELADLPLGVPFR